MIAARSNAVQQSLNVGTFGLVLGTLGRQGSPAVLKNLQVTDGHYVVLLHCFSSRRVAHINLIS